MRTDLFYFTGTGNSLVVARDICRKLKGNLISIASSMESETITNTADTIGIVFPVFYANIGGVPLIVERFVKKLRNLESKYIFAVCTHAGGPGSTIETMKKLIKDQGGTLALGFNVKMAIPYSVSLKMKRALFHKEFDAKGEILKDAGKQQEVYDFWKNKLEKIIKHIRNHEEGIFEITGALIKAISSPFLPLSNYIFRLHYKELVGVSREARIHSGDKSFKDLINLADNSFEVNDNCNGCGICTRVCPVENIKMVNNKPEWQHRCETCYACYVFCPNDAIQGEIVAYNKKYHHPEVKVIDMITQKSISNMECE